MNTQPTKREPLMDQQYFDSEVAYDSETIARFESKLAASTAPPQNRAKMAYTIFRKRYETLLMRYSRGEPVVEIQAGFPAVIESLERYQSLEGHQEMTVDRSFDDYVISLWLVSLGISFHVDSALFARLVGCIGNAGKDSLLEKLIGTRIPDRPGAKQLAWPKIYRTLDEAATAPPESRAKLLQTFLENWYSSMQNVYWYDNHKGPDGGGFFGYWCLEAAGVVNAFGFDDSSFRDFPYYPKDLAHPAAS